MDGAALECADTAREVLFLQLLQDAAQTDHFLRALNRKGTISLPSVKLVVAQQKDKARFQTTFLNWIIHQCQPFVTYRALDHIVSEPCLFEAARANVSESVSNCTSALTACTVLQSTVNGTATSGAPNLPPKLKKRMTVNSIPTPVGLTFSGNIASTPNSADRMCMTLPKASSSVNKSAFFSVHMDTATISPSSTSESVLRMSAIFTALIINQHIIFSDAIPLLAKLCSLSLPGPDEKMQIVVTVAENEKFPTLLLSSELYHLFTIETMKKLLPLLTLLGDRVTSGFAESPVISRYKKFRQNRGIRYKAIIYF